MLRKPSSWADCQDAARSADLQQLLTIRLVELAFSDAGAVAIRAIEMLRGGTGDMAVDEFADVPVEVLLAARDRVEARLRSTFAQPDSSKDYAKNED